MRSKLERKIKGVSDYTDINREMKAMNDWFEKTSHTSQTHFWKCPNTKCKCPQVYRINHKIKKRKNDSASSTKNLNGLRVFKSLQPADTIKPAFMAVTENKFSQDREHVIPKMRY